MNELIGNLKEAKRMAKGYKTWFIRESLIERGYSLNKAVLTADWLKGRDCWQVACNAQ